MPEKPTTQTASSERRGHPFSFFLLWELTRPETLVLPLLGMATGAITALGAGGGPRPSDPWLFLRILAGASCSASLNAASNILNQICDVEIDRANKPFRPLPSGRITKNAALCLSLFLYALGLFPTLWLAADGGRSCFILFFFAAASSCIYSVPLLGRTKRLGLWANLTIALPRGCLLKVAGWSLAGTVLDPEPWYIGCIFMLFLLGATSTKDFADIEGDRTYGIHTLPVSYGVRQAALWIAPAFVLPWLLIPLGCILQNPWRRGSLPMLSGHPALLVMLSLLLAVWGVYVIRLMLRKPEELARSGNHPSWSHMYRMMVAAHLGFAFSYCIPGGRAYN